MPVGSAFDGSSRALLPVRKRSGRDELVLWGRKEGEPGDSELIPSVPINTIKNGEWEMYTPRWVKLFLSRFQMPDAEGTPHWHELPQGAFLQGVLIKDTDDRHTRRVYIASIDVPQELAELSQSGQWPHVSEPFADGEITKPAGPDSADDQVGEQTEDSCAEDGQEDGEDVSRH
ncbi:MAG: hypothetical protein OEN20_09900 [Gammaproteobacteria bacterium]|nr:hypothetical protein [Gammaproteobacteria bacterium]